MALNSLDHSIPRMQRLGFTPQNTNLPGDTLVIIFLRGAADVLNMVVPHGEGAYYDLRPNLGIGRPDDKRVNANERVIDLDGFFGFHPAMRSLLDAWDSGHLAIIHACGAPDESRSHFKAMELMERGVEDERGPASGWIGRHLATLNTGNLSPFRAIGMGTMLQRSLTGPVPVSTLRSITDFHLGDDTHTIAQMQAVINTLYSTGDPIDKLAQETLSIIDILQSLDPGKYIPQHGAKYPEDDFSFALKQTAMLIKAEVGLEATAIDLGGWDTHFAQGATKGQMANLMGRLSAGLSAFHADMLDHFDNLTLVTMSEFGRRVSENASLGTDHGHGSLMMVMGGNVVGGKIYGTWPGLEPEQLVDPGDLGVTTDYRDILAEICARRLHNPAIEEIFPNFDPTFGNILRAS